MTFPILLLARDRRVLAKSIATELSHDALKVNPFIPMVLLWIGAFVRDPSVFF